MPIPSFLKQAATPGSTGFLIACIAIWVLLKYVWPRNRRIAWSWLVTFAAGYLIMGLPCVANVIADRLPRDRSSDQRLTDGVDTLVVFDGDNRLGRIREARRVYTAAHPNVVHVLGAQWFVEALVDAGLPPTVVAQDSRPSTTREQVEWLQHRLTSKNQRVAVIASRLQMPRVAALAQAAGLSLILIASPIDDEPPTQGVRVFVPSYIALRVSRDALYEHAALAYYAWRGWIRPR